MKAKELEKQMKEYLPPIFAATEIDSLTGNAVRWASLQNQRSKDKRDNTATIPEACFVNDGPRKTLIVRDPFVEWWISKLHQ